MGSQILAPKVPVPQPGALSRDDYTFLKQYIHRESGILIEDDKHYLLEARLLPIVRREALTSLPDLCNLLRSVQGYRIRRQVVEAMTTNETLFFRELSQYEALRKTVIPELAAQRAVTRKLSFWSAAASSGQEAYSTAMMLLEMGYRDWTLQILGTDLNESILGRAREGQYMQIEVNRGLPVNYLLTYFDREGSSWRMKKYVRDMVSFQAFDLRHSMRSLGRFDIIFCRNVLIYFDNDTKKKILAEIQNALNPGGYLLLGGAENTLNLDLGLQRVEIGSAVLYQAR